MKRILFITDTYFPDSSATTSIVARTAEALAERGYGVDVYPAEVSGNHFSYREMCNGVRVLAPDIASRSVVEEGFPLGTRPRDSFNYIVNSIKKILDSAHYDFIFSVAVNFEVNFLAQCAVKGRDCFWFPMSYDPYAFDPHITEGEKGKRIAEEIDCLKDAERIFFLEEFRGDYAGSPLEKRITYFNLPCIRPIGPARLNNVMEFDSSFINCVFLGDFYYGVENTDFIFRLFQGLGKDIRLYTIGNLGDYEETVNLWERELGGRYICCARISQKEAHSVMLESDVLVSMGHDSPNMCPSKVIDFVSSGKPILHISKIRNCCAEKYLERYPNKYCIYQGEELTAEKLYEVERFIHEAKTKESVPFEQVAQLYEDFTMEALVGKIAAALNDCD